MDLMRVRRRMMAQATEKDYLKGVEWELGKTIGNDGEIFSNQYCKYTSNAIYLPSGTYLLSGVSSTGANIYFRFHEYDVSDNWVKMLAIRAFAEGEVVWQVTIPNSTYIRLSLKESFEGTLTQV